MILCENQDIEFLTTLDQNIEQCTIESSECGSEQRTIYTMKWDSQCKPENFLFELSVWRPKRALGNQELVSNRNTLLSFDLCSNQSRIGNKELLWTHESFNFRKTAHTATCRQKRARFISFTSATADIPMIESSLEDSIFSKLLPLMISTYITNADCSIWKPPRMESCFHEPNVSGSIHWIVFVTAYTGWSHVSKGICDGFNKFVIFLFRFITWYIVSNLCISLLIIGRMALTPTLISVPNLWNEEWCFAHPHQLSLFNPFILKLHWFS